jgi:hypothetical protein
LNSTTELNKLRIYDKKINTFNSAVPGDLKKKVSRPFGVNNNKEWPEKTLYTGDPEGGNDVLGEAAGNPLRYAQVPALLEADVVVDVHHMALNDTTNGVKMMIIKCRGRFTGSDFSVKTEAKFLAALASGDGKNQN